MNEKKNFSLSLSENEVIYLGVAVSCVKYLAAVAGCRSNSDLFSDLEKKLLSLKVFSNE